jgi:hypothetical protein
MQFAFWKEKSPKFWNILRANPLAFFEDDGEISLSRLSSLIANSPNHYDVAATGNAFRFQKIGKETLQNFEHHSNEVILNSFLFLSKIIGYFIIGTSISKTK